MVNLKTYGLDKDGLLLIELWNYKFDEYFREIMLKEYYIKEEKNEYLI